MSHSNDSGRQMEPNWRLVRDNLQERIVEGKWSEGDRMPSEMELGTEFRVGRHSVRRALAALAAEGLLSVEQGRGTFVRQQPQILYRIGRRTRYGENLRAQGLIPGGDAISAKVGPAPARVALALALETGAPVHHILRRGRADGTPISLGLSFHCVRAFPDMANLRNLGRSTTEIYRDHGIEDYVRRDTMLYARLPEPWEAKLLEQKPDQPVMVQCKTDAARDGRPLGHSEAIWCATRVRFSLESCNDENNDE